MFDKAKDLVGDNADKITDGVDQATDMVDDKTDGKYTDHLDKVDEAADDVAKKLSDES